MIKKKKYVSLPTINSTMTSGGRFGNQFIRNMCFHILSKKYDIKFEYSCLEQIKEFGIDLFVDGTKTYNDGVEINDGNFMNYVKGSDIIENNMILGKGSYMQTKEFALYLQQYFKEEGLFQKIINSSKFKNRFNNNNDLYVHVRIGDVSQFTPPFEYFDSVISKLDFVNGYISSDTIESDICHKLMEKYKLKEYIGSETDTILFGASCKNIVLSHGTFSWLIGFMEIYSNVFFKKIEKFWHGDIFVFPEWNEVK